MNTRFLETFIWLARLKSFNRTAEKLHSSQPAVSGRIAALENLLGVALYDRAARGFELTAAGRRILDRCQKIVDLTRELKIIAADGDLLGRPVRIGVSDVITLSWLQDLVDILPLKFPAHTFDIVTDAAPNLAAYLRSDDLDLALMAHGLDEPKVINAPLCSYRVAWLANPKRFDVRTELSVEQLCEWRIIMPPAGTPGYVWQTEYLKRHNPSDQYSDGPMRLSCGFSPATGIEMVARGLGVMPLPVMLARPQIDRGEIAILPVREPFPAWYMVGSYKAPPTISLVPSLVETAQAVAKAFADRRGSTDLWP